MERIVRILDVKEGGAVTAVQDLLWRMMEKDVVQGLLVPLQAHPNEAPAPTLIKSRERLEKANPLAPVMTLNSAKIVGLLLAQESGKRLAAVMRPCEVRALVELAGQGRVSLDDLVTIGIDCLGSHDEDDYGQRAVLWGDDAPTRESLRWSRRGQIASYRFRQACQICEQPYFDQAAITIGLFGQNVNKSILIFADASLGGQIGLTDSGWSRPATEAELDSRQKTIGNLVAQRHKTRQRLLTEVHQKTAELTDLLAMLSSCTLCGECQEACPLFEFDMNAYADNTPEYVAARILNLTQRAESCVGCGMCEAACQLGVPLMLVTQMLADRTQVRESVVAALVGKEGKSVISEVDSRSQ
jgi:formate dehydrogenase subunit beta